MIWRKDEQAIRKELTQLHNLEVLHLLDASQLTEEGKNATASLMFMTEKRNGTIKARTCVDGRKQRGCIAKKEKQNCLLSTLIQSSL